ncbi:MAG TPA: inositol monophosphatase family protein [Polyangiaceae bacterium]
MSAQPADIRELALIAEKVAAEAGLLAAKGFRRPLRVMHKTVVDLVTEFDIASEDLIRERLAQETPSIPVVAEEKGGTPGPDWSWYVDPIDGTTNYAHGHPIWCVSIGLVNAGKVVAGAVAAPAIQSSWTGGVGVPARRNGELCRVSDTTELDRGLLATGFPYDRRTSPENNFAAFVALKKLAFGVRRCGSAALDLCFVADGTYDGYWERKLAPWDIAGGSAIVLAAGGEVTDLDGGPVDLARGYIMASNGHLHEALQFAVRNAG